MSHSDSHVRIHTIAISHCTSKNHPRIDKPEKDQVGGKRQYRQKKPGKCDRGPKPGVFLVVDALGQCRNHYCADRAKEQCYRRDKLVLVSKTLVAQTPESTKEEIDEKALDTASLLVVALLGAVGRKRHPAAVTVAGRTITEAVTMLAAVGRAVAPKGSCGCGLNRCQCVSASVSL